MNPRSRILLAISQAQLALGALLFACASSLFLHSLGDNCRDSAFYRGAP